MSVVLLISDHGEDDRVVVTPRRTRLRDRVEARLCAARLDGALARGVPPESSAPLELRAQALIGPVARQLGDQLRQLIRAALVQRRTPLNDAPVECVLIRESLPELARLADRLLDGRPVDACGVARVRGLLRDHGGPLYGRPDGLEDLRAALDRALSGLEIQLSSEQK